MIHVEIVAILILKVTFLPWFLYQTLRVSYHMYDRKLSITQTTRKRDVHFEKTDFLSILILFLRVYSEDLFTFVAEHTEVSDF